MNILIISSGKLPIPDVCGGAVEYLVNELAKNSPQKYKVDICSVYNKEAELAAKSYNSNIKFIFIEMNLNKKINKIKQILLYFLNKYSTKYYGNYYIRKVYKKIKKTINCYDKIIIENVPEFGLFLKSKKCDNLILHLHNDYININSKNSKKICQCYKKIIAISHFIKRRVLEVDEQCKVEVVHNGIDLKKFRSDEKMSLEYRKKFQISTNDLVFAYSGRITKEKGTYELIKAFLKLEEKYSNIKLVIIGGINYNSNKKNKYLQKIEEQSSISKNIIFTGFIKHEEISKIYNMININILPTLINEAFGMSIIEFRSMGIPTLASSNGAGSELIKNKYLGSIINLDKNQTELEIEKNILDKMTKYIEFYKKNKKEIREECIKNVDTFSIKRYASNFFISLKE